MKVLIAPQFNDAMRELDPSLHSEVFQLYSMVSGMTREALIHSPLVTKISEEMFTLRSAFTRVFFYFADDDSVVFVTLDKVRFPSFESPKPTETEVTLYGPQGDPKVYIDTAGENTVYTFDGRPLAYIEGENIYGFNGAHLGWYEDGVVWDHRGQRVGFISTKCPMFTKYAPFKSFKRFKPFKDFRKFAPFKPFKQLYSRSPEDLIDFFARGEKPATWR